MAESSEDVGAENTHTCATALGGRTSKKVRASEQWRAAMLGGKARHLSEPVAAAALAEAFPEEWERPDASRFFWCAFRGDQMPSLDGPI